MIFTEEDISAGSLLPDDVRCTVEDFQHENIMGRTLSWVVATWNAGHQYTNLKYLLTHDKAGVSVMMGVGDHTCNE